MPSWRCSSAYVILLLSVSIFRNTVLWVSTTQYDPMFNRKINEGHCDLYFTVHLFCLISWRLCAVWTSYFGIMSQYDPTFDLKINVGHCDLYFMVQWFLPYILKTIWCMSIILWDYESVWPNIWSQNKCRFLWPIFHGAVILSFILKTVYVWTSLFGIMSQYDRTFDFKINVGHCDVWFMVHWFCFISPRPFDGWVSIFR